LNSRDRKQIQYFYKSIKGDWQGESVFTDCRGSSRAMKVHSQKYDMETGVEIGRDNTIRFQTEKRDDNKKTIDVAYYFDEENLFHFRRSGTKIQAEEKYYQPNGSDSHLVENLISCDTKGKNILLKLYRT
jgi:hypothetical protein